MALSRGLLRFISARELSSGQGGMLKSKIYRGLRVPVITDPFKPGLVRKLMASRHHSSSCNVRTNHSLHNRTSIKCRPSRQRKVVDKFRKVLRHIPLKAILGIDQSIKASIIWFIFWMTVYGILMLCHHGYIATLIIIMSGVVKFCHDVHVDSKALGSGCSGYATSDSDAYYDDFDESLFEEEFDDDNDWCDSSANSWEEPNAGASKARRYYDSIGTYIGYRDEQGWVHGDRGQHYIGRIDDDGSFYDSSGMYRGTTKEDGYLWEDRKGYTGYQDGNRFSSEGNYGIPEVYEEGGEGTAGAFKRLYEDANNDE